MSHSAIKIVMLDQMSCQRPDETFNYEKIHALGELVIYPDSTAIEIIERCQDATVIIVNKPVISAETIRQLPMTRLILKLGIGVDNIDLTAAQQQGIRVSNFPAYNLELLAQWTFNFILTLAGHLVPYTQAFKRGEWLASLFRFPIQEVAGKCLGIIGFGHSGRRVAELAQAFKMEVLVHTDYPDANQPYAFVDLMTLARQADFITLHRQLTPPAKGMIDATFLQTMKSTAYLINTARAGLIDEAALITALQQEQIAGFAADVFWQEPAPVDHPLYHLDQVILTPHMAWGAQETRQRLFDQVAITIDHYLQDKPFHAVV